MKFAFIAACIFACALARKITPQQWNCSMSAKVTIPAPDPQMIYDDVRHYVGMVHGKNRYMFIDFDNGDTKGVLYQRSDVKDKDGKCLQVSKDDSYCREEFIDCDHIKFPVFEPFYYKTKKIVKCPNSSEMNCIRYYASEFTYITMTVDDYLLEDQHGVRYEYYGAADPKVFNMQRCNGEKLPVPKNPCAGYY